MEWQFECKQRGARFLRESQWSDCSFLVGTGPDQELVLGHRVVLAMASPKFEEMFNECMSEIKEPIPIVDIQKDTFLALLQYIYTGKVYINSFNEICELYCAAQKYMLLYLVKECTEYICLDINPSNVWKTYNLACQFKHKVLKRKCIKIISTNTKEVLNSSFEEVELKSVITVFSLDHLNVDSELDLLEAAVRYINATKARNNKNINQPTALESSLDKKEEPCIRNLVEKIRFMTLSAEEFATCHATTPLLTETEAFAVLMNIVNRHTDLPLPPGFSTTRLTRNRFMEENSNVRESHNTRHIQVVSGRRSLMPNFEETASSTNMSCIGGITSSIGGKIYCRRALLQPSLVFACVPYCSVAFTVDKEITILGIQLQEPEKTADSEGIKYDCCAELLQPRGVTFARATFAHGDKDVLFERGVRLQRHKVYKVSVVLKGKAWYPMVECERHVKAMTVSFDFGDRCNSVRDGLIRSLIFR